MKQTAKPRRITLRASAKVNLSLEVLSKRPDGYHEVATVMHAVDLHDRLILEAAPTLSFRSDDPDLPTDDTNLVVRAARLTSPGKGGLMRCPCLPASAPRVASVPVFAVAKSGPAQHGHAAPRSLDPSPFPRALAVREAGAVGALLHRF